jgi:hypothetical protein
MRDDSRNRGEDAGDQLEAPPPDARHSSENAERAQGAATMTATASTESILL